jgi:hypothetical protein
MFVCLLFGIEVRLMSPENRVAVGATVFSSQQQHFVCAARESRWFSKDIILWPSCVLAGRCGSGHFDANTRWASANTSVPCAWN